MLVGGGSVAAEQEGNADEWIAQMTLATTSSQSPMGFAAVVIVDWLSD